MMNTHHFYHEKRVISKFNKSIYIVLIATSDQGNVGTKEGKRKVTRMVRGMDNKLTLSDLGIIQKLLKYVGGEWHSQHSPGWEA